MKIAIPKETKVKENRVSITPDTIKDLIKKGFSCTIEKGAGDNLKMMCTQPQELQ